MRHTRSMCKKYNNKEDKKRKREMEKRIPLGLLYGSKIANLGFKVSEKWNAVIGASDPLTTAGASHLTLTVEKTVVKSSQNTTVVLLV